jgi:exodeoxyribonuclease VII small subunit
MATKKETKKEEVPELQISFEKALEKLEGIVDEMESGKLSLEVMISRFEESQKLIKFCGAKLNEVERKIEILVKKDGKTTAEPFDEGIVEEGKDDPF